MSRLQQYLKQASDGNAAAIGAVFEIVHAELRSMAHSVMANERPGLTLQPTALVNEAYLRLFGNDGPIAFENQAHFFGAAAQAMRQILIEAARRKATLKRGGQQERVELDPDDVAAPERSEELLNLDAAIQKLAAERPIVAELVNLRYFGGLTIRESASVLGLAPRTADSYWAYAKAYLSAEIRKMQN